MPEKELSSRNNGRDEDAAQNHKHLGEISPEELEDALADMWDAMDETNYNPEQIDVYLAELEEKEANSPSFDADVSLAAFHEKHAQLFEQTSPVQISTVVKPTGRRWRTSMLAAVIAIVVMFCSMVTAQAFGFDIFGAIARWTEETFQFSFTSQSSDEQAHRPAPATEGKFTTLQEALETYGIDELIAPQWFPAGFNTVNLSATPRKTGITIQANYEADGKVVSISVRRYDSMENANIGEGSFEKDAENITKYESNGVAHYILSNNSSYVATWTNGTLVCSIMGDLTVDELKQMIDSIYEG